MPEYINDLHGTGHIGDLAGFENELKSFGCKDVYIRKYGSGDCYFCTGGEVGYSWTEEFKTILQKYFSKAFVCAETDDYQLRFIVSNGMVKVISGETLTYFPGYEDEFIEQLPREVINKIRRAAR